MFQPISRIEYLPLDADQQILVCTLSASPAADIAKKWANRAAAAFPFHPDDDVCDVIRDVLANPQIRAIVFEGEGLGRTRFSAFWDRSLITDWGINEEHLEMVRQFVDLFDEDCGFNKPKQPFWPIRLKYNAPET